MDMEDVVALMTVQHAENISIQNEQTRLLELWTAEDRVNNVRLAMLEEVLKKMLNTGTGLSETCQELLEELKR